MKYSLEEKMEVLNDDTFNHFANCQRRLYCMYRDDVKALPESKRPAFMFWLSKHPATEYRIWSEINSGNKRRSECDFYRALKVCRSIYNNNKARSARLKNKIEQWNKIGCLYFVTLTFSDSTLEKTTPEYRRKCVQRFFNDLGILYCANIDYGEEKGREHYHAIICTPDPLPGKWVKEKSQLFLRSPLFDKWSNHFGFYNILKVTLDEASCDSRRISKYISKLTQHALKKSTTGARFVCNRKLPEWAKERGIT